MPIAEAMKAMWMMVCHITPGSVTRLPSAPTLPAMNVLSRWIEEMPMIAVASLT